MSNSTTDQLRIAEKIVISTFWPFRKSLKPEVNYHQIIFRSGTYFGELSAGSATTQTFRVLDRDIVIQVYNQSRTYPMNGTVRTRDKYRRVYDGQLIVEVVDPIKFATAYFQEKDPIGEALGRIKRIFEQQAANCDHDQIPSHPWPFETWSMQFCADTGVCVKLLEKFMFRFDAEQSERAQFVTEMRLRTEKFRLEQAMAEEQEQCRRTSEATSKETERREKELQNEFERREKTKDQLYKICYELREIASTQIKEALQARIQESFACGHTPSQISEEYFALLSIFQDSMHIEHDKRIAAGLFIDSDLNYEFNDEDDFEKNPDEEITTEENI